MIGLPYTEESMSYFLQYRNVRDGRTDGQTDGRTDRRTDRTAIGLSILRISVAVLTRESKPVTVMSRKRLRSTINTILILCVAQVVESRKSRFYTCWLCRACCSRVRCSGTYNWAA